MAELTVIEQGRQGEADGVSGFYMKLTTDEENQNFIVNYKLMGVSVIETIGSGSPVVAMTLMDTFGDLINHKIIEGSFEFKLYLANTNQTNDAYVLTPSSINSINSELARNDALVYNINMVSHLWPNMFMKRYSRSWTEMKYSDVIEEIATEMGFQQISVTPTKKVIPLIIQPYWTNYRMLCWMKDRCEAQNDQLSGSFSFASTINDGFYFKSIGDLIKTRHADVNPPIESGVKRLTMDQKPPGPNDNTLRRALKLEITQNYMSMVVNGAGGAQPAHYDYMNKEYVQGDPIIYSESNEPQLSDWAFLSEEHEIPEKRVYTHGVMDDVVVAKNKVSDATSSIQQVKATIDGVSDIQMGEVVEVQIPLSPENSKIIYNEYFSGFYVVTERRLNVDLNTTRAKTVLYLSRQGVNGAENDTLVSSIRGKSL